jgi:glutathione S-transferase
MKLYWGPHTCAIGIHILLEEAGASYETVRIDVAGGATHQPDFLQVNPKGKVPALVRDDGSVLTEFGAIATWLAKTHPDKKLLPDDPEAQARAVEMLEYVEGTVHGQGFGRLFKPKAFDPSGQHEHDVEKQGKKILNDAFGIIDRQLASRAFAAGDSFSIADAALFYVERWAPAKQISLPPNVAQHFQRMLSRPSTGKVRALWGES